MNRRYLEFDSTYRNRNCYPCPADFVTKISCTSSINDGISAKDYVSGEYPSITWYQVPFAGSDPKNFINAKYLTDTSPGTFDEASIKIPYTINGNVYTSLWPVDWMDGSQGSGATTGVVGSAFTWAGGPTDWNDIIVRNQNIVSPEFFSGGTPSAPQLGPSAVRQAKTRGYMAGALLIRFTTNPAKDTSAQKLGSLSTPYWYQKLTFSGPSVPPAVVGDTMTDASGAAGFIACIISSQEVLVRLGANPPVQIPPLPSPTSFDGSAVLINGIAWSSPTSISTSSAQYVFCGFVETSVITSYDQNTGIVNIETPFLSGGPNAFNPGFPGGPGVIKDTYLIDFNTDPTSYWQQVQEGVPRLFRPAGLDIQNNMKGLFIETLTVDQSRLGNGLGQAQVATYDNTRRLCYLADSFSIIPPSTIASGPVVSVYTIVFLANPLSVPLPVGSIVKYTFFGDKVFKVGVTVPAGATSVAFEGATNPDIDATSLLRLPANANCSFVCCPPWIEDAYAYWKTNPVADLNAGAGNVVSIAGINGAESSILRGLTPLSLTRTLIPGIATVSTQNQEGMGFMIRDNGVFSLNILDSGQGYKVTPPNEPIMALYTEPISYNPALGFQNMKPAPEEINGIYTFLNICFVNITAVDIIGRILNLTINTPGNAYSRSSQVFLIDGTSNGSQWIKGNGKGARAIVECASQYISIFGDKSIRGIPKLGDLVYMPSYGWGLPASPSKIYNAAPQLAYFQIKYSGLEAVPGDWGFSALQNEFPRTLQNCLADAETFTETGTRRILQSIRTKNKQILVPQNIPIFQYNAPGAYLSDSIGVLHISIESAYKISSFLSAFNVAHKQMVDPDFAWSGTPSIPGQFVNHTLAPPNIINVSSAGTANVLEILQFSRDYEVPLNYTGSTVSQNQMVCYEIELISLILPNQPLDNNIGGLIAFYPMVYVELSNVSAPSAGIKGVLYSNNPNANHALFEVAIDDTPTPTISAFIKLDGNGAVQTVKFKPNDNLHLRVFMQDGTLFKTQLKDNMPPLNPNVFVQISAEFSIKRLT